MYYRLQSHEYNCEPTLPMWEGTLPTTSSFGSKLESLFEMSLTHPLLSNLRLGHRILTPCILSSLAH